MFFFKQKTAYEMRISDWSSDVCASRSTRSIMSRRLSQQPDRRKERGGERPELLAQLLPDPAGGKYSGVADEEVALDEKQRAGVLHDAGTAGHDIADPHRDEEVDVHLDCRLGSILVAHPTVHAEEPVGERHQHSAMHDAAEVGMFLRRLKGERHTLLVAIGR